MLFCIVTAIQDIFPAANDLDELGNPLSLHKQANNPQPPIQ